MAKLHLPEAPGLVAIALITTASIIIYQVVATLLLAYRSDLRSIPGPKWAKFTPLYRISRLWDGQASEFYNELHAKYGPVVRTGPDTVSFADPADLQTIYGIGSQFLKTAFYTTFSGFYEDELMSTMFSTRDPVYHKSLKRPVAAKFSMSTIKTFEPLVDECSDIFIAAMKDLEGQKIDLGEWLQWYAFDVIGMITFNRRFGFTEQRTDVLDMISGIETVLKYSSLAGQVPRLHKCLAGNNTVMKILERIPFVQTPSAIRTITEFTQECVDDYDRRDVEGTPKNGPDFLTMFRQEEKKNNDTMRHRDLINHLSNNLLAGSDTTAISLRAMFYFIVKNPSTYQRLRREIDDADRDGKLSPSITFAESLELEYLQVVMKEAMRCHPGVSYPLERHVPKGGATLAGRKFKEGTNVSMNAAVIHKDVRIYGPDAAFFRPERWLEASTEQVHIMDRTIMTFGYGARTCIGKNISLMEMGKFVPQILREFDVSWASDQQEWTIHTYWFAKQTGLHMKFKSRNKSQ